MKLIKKILSNIHRYILWLLLSAIFWSWVFFALTDTNRAKKVVIYANVPSVSEFGLAEELEKHKPDGIRMIKVRPAGYSGFDPSVLDEADIFILTAEDIEANTDRLSPVSGFEGEELLTVGGSAYGICVYSVANGLACAKSFIGYSDGESSAAYYICFNKDSVHTKDLNDSKDNAALETAAVLLGMKD